MYFFKYTTVSDAIQLTILSSMSIQLNYFLIIFLLQLFANHKNK